MAETAALPTGFPYFLHCTAIRLRPSFSSRSTPWSPFAANDVHLVARRAKQIRHKVLELPTVHGVALGSSSLKCSGEGVLKCTLSFAVLAQKPLPHYEGDDAEYARQQPFPHGESQ
jgi:hypothetical protein